MASLPTLLIAFCAAGAVAGCLDNELDPADLPADGDDAPFIALQRDFQTFRSWPVTAVYAGAEPVPGGHAAGPRNVYVSRPPLAGADGYPTGAILVKTSETGAPESWEIHARVKRGGAFNGAGARGWEWFDLQIATSGEVTIVWRGERPPADHGYESLPGLGGTGAMDGDCNGCHAAGAATDYILSPPLQAELAP